jgi:hypothetical protein
VYLASYWTSHGVPVRTLQSPAKNLPLSRQWPHTYSKYVLQLVSPGQVAGGIEHVPGGGLKSMVPGGLLQHVAFVAAPSHLFGPAPDPAQQWPFWQHWPGPQSALVPHVEAGVVVVVVPPLGVVVVVALGCVVVVVPPVPGMPPGPQHVPRGDCRQHRLSAFLH